MQKGVGFFDSGVGGLALLAECFRRCPAERWIYFGDNANAPYGNRSAEEIARLAEHAVERLSRRVRAVVIACNTVTAECADALRARFPFPVFGIEPALRPACVRGGRVLLLATRATLASARVRALISANTGKAEIVEYCPAHLAGDIEAQAPNVRAVDLSRHLPAGNFSAVVLGCTHYALVGDRIAAYYGCPVFDGIAGTADHLFRKMNICSENCKNRQKKSPIFLGRAKKTNKTTFLGLF